MKIYIAGPMRGMKEHNFPQFEAAAQVLEEAGHTVLSPARHDLESGFDPKRPAEEQGFDLCAAFEWDIRAVLEADAILLLNGWENSAGSMVELAVARACGRSIFLLVDPQTTALFPYGYMRELLGG